MTLWLAFALLCIVAVVALWPWARGHGRAAPDAYQARLAVFRHRLEELDADLAAGTLDPQRHAEAKRELENAAAEELGDSAVSAPQGTSIRSERMTYAAIAVLVPALALAVYWSLGTHQELDRIAHTSPTGGEFDTLLAQLAARMADNPDDLQGWMLLGRSSIVTGNLMAAERAWRQALRLAPKDSTVLANLAEALVLIDESALEGEAGDLIEAALVADPDNPKALWYGGLLAELRGHTELARLRWEALLALDPPDEFRVIIQQRLGTGPAIMAFGLSVLVTLHDSLASDVPTSGLLFVTVHDATNPSGPPLAAVRTGLSAVGSTIRISDADLMLPGGSLADHAELRVVARISRSGMVERRSGDWVGETIWRVGQPLEVQLVIDRVEG